MTIKTAWQEAGKEGNMRTISIMNLKGGVAKTTSADNMAYILSKRGYRVLMVDNDKQGDLSRGFKRRTTSGDGINCIMTDDEPDMETLIKHTDYENLDIITANLTLLNANREVEMDVTRTHHDRIKTALNIVRDQYDFALIDCPPDLNIGVVNALCASNDVLIPVEIDDNTTEGMEELWQQISKIQRRLNPDLKIVKCFISKFQKYNEAHKQGIEAVRKFYPTMKTVIRTSPIVAKSTFVKEPVVKYSPRAAASVDYESLVTEYLDAIGERQNG